MMELSGRTLGQAIFSDIDSNKYLCEIYDNILLNYAKRMFRAGKEVIDMPVNIDDALQFADLLSNSNNPQRSDAHKIMAQEIVALLHQMYPDDKKIAYYLTDVLSNVGNYRGINVVKNATEGVKISFLDRLCQQYDKDKMRIPAEPDKQFFRTQAFVYNHLNDQYFSYSGPTSMGKSFIMRMFIKQQLLEGVKKNFVIVVPTKALINEVSNKIIKEDLQDMLVERNYRVVTASGDLVLRQQHNFIFVLTPERLLYLMIDNPALAIDYLFVDEAHKISTKDDRSTFYYKIVERLSNREPKPHIVFASPNIPNPEVYLRLLNQEDFEETQKIASTYSPVSQMKYLVNYNTREVQLFNDHEKKLTYIGRMSVNATFNDLIKAVGKKSQNIVYCSSINNAVSLAIEYAKTQADMKEKELYDIAKDVRQEVHGDYYLADIITTGVAYHIGYLPTTIRLRIEELFRKGLIRTLFCTSTLVEGVNLPADNLFVTNYKIGRPIMNTVDFKNLIGRVGRIEYNLYGNVFLVCLNDKVKQEKYVELLTDKLPEQKLSVVSGLTGPQKKMIVDNLLKGEVELPKYPKNQTADNYALMRKFSIILLKDITSGRDSLVKKAFAQYLTPENETRIKEVFHNSAPKVDEDINISVDQSNNLTYAVRQGLYYPELTGTLQTDYDNLVDFLEQLCNIFKWDKYESDTLGHRSKKDGTHGRLRWYAVILLQWINGSGLSFIMTQAIEHKQNTPGSTVLDKDGYTYVEYNDSKEHKNSVISEVLSVIENVILYRISNYFLKFSNEYKQVFQKERLQNDWYEYVEYGTRNPLSIILQQSGFTREASRYIKENKDTLIIEKADGQLYISKRILECGNRSVEEEAKRIIYNVPEIFI